MRAAPNCITSWYGLHRHNIRCPTITYKYSAMSEIRQLVTAKGYASKKLQKIAHNICIEISVLVR